MAGIKEEERLSGQRTARGKAHKRQQHPQWLSCSKFCKAGARQGVQVGSAGRGQRADAGTSQRPWCSHSLVYWAFRISWPVPVPMCVLGMHYPSNERQWLPGRGLGSGRWIVSAHVIVVVVFLLFGFVYLCSMT